MVLDTEMRRALYLFYISERKSNLHFLCHERTTIVVMTLMALHAGVVMVNDMVIGAGK